MRTQRFLISPLVIFFLGSLPSWAEVPLNWNQLLQEGDLIFQMSTSSQRPALQEATGSPWTHVGIAMKNKSGKWMVLEASSKVSLTPIAKFIQKGERQQFVIQRIRSNYLLLDAKALNSLRQESLKYMGKSYDIYFEWSDQLIYCSELPWKILNGAFPKLPAVADLQKFKDLNLSGPEVQKLVHTRLDPVGKTLNPEEPIITPIGLMNSPNLQLVYKSND